MSSSLSPFHVLVLVLLELYTTAGVNGCSVTPSSAAVVAGDNLTLTCTTKDTSEYITSWRLGSDSYSAPRLYQAPNSETALDREVEDGYLVNDSNLNIQVNLTIVKASTSQANYYYCLCTKSRSPYAFVSVLASEPVFYDAMGTTDGEPVSFTCSVSFNGTANTSLIIKDSSGGSSITETYDGTSMGLHNFSLDYNVNTNSSINQNISCDIQLKSIDMPNAVIYSKNLNASIQWLSVRDVQINPVDGTQCKDGQQCSLNQTVRCIAKGRPKPYTFQWLTSVNGGGFKMNERSDDIFNFSTTGQYHVQCYAFNQFGGTQYNSSSVVFKTEVVNEQLNYLPSGEQNSGNSYSKAALIGGVLGAVGGAIIVIVIIIFLIYKRKKSRRVCCKLDGEEMGSNQSVELSKTHNGNSTDNGAKKNGHITPGVQNKGFEKNLNDEVTLVENDLYSGKSKPQIDPSDGGYASVNEIEAQGK